MKCFGLALISLALMAPLAIPASAAAQPRAGAVSSDEAELQKFSALSQAVFKKTKANVEARLANLDDKANNLFDHGTEIAIAAMKAFVEERLAPFKSTLFGAPPEADRIYDEGRKQFEQDLKALTVRVANVIADEVAGAKKEIKTAEAEIAAAQAKLPSSVKARAAKQRADWLTKLRAVVDRAEREAR